MLSAQSLRFTFTGTAKSTYMGYTQNQACTFSFVLNDYSPSTANGYAYANSSCEWLEGTTADAMLFSDVSGTGLTGSWTRPTDHATSPFSSITVYTDGRISVFAGTESYSYDPNDTGLTLASGTYGAPVNFQNMRMEMKLNGTEFTTTNSIPDSINYFSGYVGTYSLAANPEDYHLGTIYDFANHYIDFELTSLTISEVPEPAEAAGTLGASCLALFFLRRKKKA
jgi:hypothetical protein